MIHPVRLDPYHICITDQVRIESHIFDIHILDIGQEGLHGIYKTFISTEDHRPFFGLVRQSNSLSVLPRIGGLGLIILLKTTSRRSASSRCSRRACSRSLSFCKIATAYFFRSSAALRLRSFISRLARSSSACMSS